MKYTSEKTLLHCVQGGCGNYEFSTKIFNESEEPCLLRRQYDKRCPIDWREADFSTLKNSLLKIECELRERLFSLPLS